MTDPIPSHTGRAARLSRLAWRCLGATALGLAAIGVVLPLLPTTPFVILAAFAFARGAPALHARLVASRLFGPAIADWQARGAIALRHKVAALTMMAAALVAAIMAGVPAIGLGVQCVAMAAAALYILSRPGTARAPGPGPAQARRPTDLHLS